MIRQNKSARFRNPTIRQTNWAKSAKFGRRIGGGGGGVVIVPYALYARVQHGLLNASPRCPHYWDGLARMIRARQRCTGGCGDNSTSAQSRLFLTVSVRLASKAITTNRNGPRERTQCKFDLNLWKTGATGTCNGPHTVHRQFLISSMVLSGVVDRNVTPETVVGHNIKQTAGCVRGCGSDTHDKPPRSHSRPKPCGKEAFGMTPQAMKYLGTHPLLNSVFKWHVPKKADCVFPVHRSGKGAMLVCPACTAPRPVRRRRRP